MENVDVKNEEVSYEVENEKDGGIKALKEVLREGRRINIESHDELKRMEEVNDDAEHEFQERQVDYEVLIERMKEEVIFLRKEKSTDSAKNNRERVSFDNFC